MDLFYFYFLIVFIYFHLSHLFSFHGLRKKKKKTFLPLISLNKIFNVNHLLKNVILFDKATLLLMIFYTFDTVTLYFELFFLHIYFDL